MAEESLSHKTLKNSGYSVLSYAAPILFSIFITPVVVHKLGVADYGIYILVNTIAAFMSLLDMGLSIALVKFVSQYNAEGNFPALAKLYNSVYLLYVLIGLLGLVVYLFLGKFFLPLFKIASESQPHIMTVFLLAGILFFISSMSTIYVSALVALQRYDISTKIAFGQLLVFNLGILAAVVLGYKLKAILLINIFSIFTAAVIYRWQFHKLLPKIRLRFIWDKASIVQAYSFGFYVAISNLASNALIQLDRFIIPIFLGPAALSYYSLPGNVAQKTSGITNSMAGVLFPVTSAMAGENRREEIKNIYRRVLRNVTLAAAAFTAAIAVFAYPILFYWLGKDFSDKGAGILVILALTYFLLSLLGAANSFLLGLNQVKFITIVSVSLAVLNVLLLLILVPKWGILGAAWAYLGAVLPVPVVFYWVEKKILKLSGVAKHYSLLYLKILFTSAIYFLLMRFFVVGLVVSKTTLIVIGPLTVLAYFALYALFGFVEPDDRRLFVSFFNLVKTRLLKRQGENS